MRVSRFQRHAVDIVQTPKRQGWWDVTLDCGHRFAVLMGDPTADVVKDAVYLCTTGTCCALCRRAEKEAHGVVREEHTGSRLQIARRNRVHAREAPREAIRVMPNDLTVAQIVRPLIGDAYKLGKMPKAAQSGTRGGAQVKSGSWWLGLSREDFAKRVKR